MMPAPLLQLDQVTIRFGGLTAVNAVDFAVNAGELCGLIGPNGAGKTTVFNLITGVYQPTSGAVFLGGRPVAGLRTNAIVELGIARTFQNIRLFGSLSVFDNVRVAANLHRATSPWQTLVRLGGFQADEAAIAQRTEELLEIFNLLRFGTPPAKSLPYGEQTPARNCPLPGDQTPPPPPGRTRRRHESERKDRNSSGSFNRFSNNSNSPSSSSNIR